MEIVAQSKSVRVSPRKVRLVADAIRKLSVPHALEALMIIKKRGSLTLEKTLRSAIANAVMNKNIAEDTLFIKSIDVTEGPAFKRFHASTRGRVHPYKKRSSHVRIVLGQKEVKAVPASKVKADMKLEDKTKKEEEKK